MRAQTNVHRGNLAVMLNTVALLDEMGVDKVRIIRTTETPHFTATKAEEGMQINFVEMPQEWTGDTDASYADRYPGYRFYGEEAAKGLS